MVYVWGVLTGVLLAGAGLVGVYRPTLYRTGPFSYIDIEGSPELIPHRKRQGIGAVFLGIVLFVGSLLI